MRSAVREFSSSVDLFFESLKRSYMPDTERAIRDFRAEFVSVLDAILGETCEIDLPETSWGACNGIPCGRRAVAVVEGQKLCRSCAGLSAHGGNPGLQQV